MEQKTREGLIEFVKGKVGTKFAYGAKGEVLTHKRLQELIAENPNKYTSQYIKRTKRNLNQICVDSPGLISWYTGKKREIQEYFNTAEKRVLFVFLDESMAGWALWKPGHIGIYIGNGEYVAATSVYTGVIRQSIDMVRWHYVLKLCDIYDPAEKIKPDLKDGWVKEGDGWRYYLNPKMCVYDTWKRDGDKWYRFDHDGYALAEQWYYENGMWYYFAADCCMVTGLKEINGKVYYFDDQGRMAADRMILSFAPGRTGALVRLNRWEAFLRRIGLGWEEGGYRHGKNGNHEE